MEALNSVSTRRRNWWTRRSWNEQQKDVFPEALHFTQWSRYKGLMSLEAERLQSLNPWKYFYTVFTRSHHQFNSIHFHSSQLPLQFPPRFSTAKSQQNSFQWLWQWLWQFIGFTLKLDTDGTKSVDTTDANFIHFCHHLLNRLHQTNELYHPALYRLLKCVRVVINKVTLPPLADGGGCWVTIDAAKSDIFSDQCAVKYVSDGRAVTLQWKCVMRLSINTMVNIGWCGAWFALMVRLVVRRVVVVWKRVLNF